MLKKHTFISRCNLERKKDEGGKSEIFFTPIQQDIHFIPGSNKPWWIIHILDHISILVFHVPPVTRVDTPTVGIMMTVIIEIKSRIHYSICMFCSGRSMQEINERKKGRVLTISSWHLP